jgi:hypothetical protein
LDQEKRSQCLSSGRKDSEKEPVNEREKGSGAKRVGEKEREKEKDTIAVDVRSSDVRPALYVVT